jgi:hypothetical protein
MNNVHSITQPAGPAANDPSPDRPENRACCSDEAVEARTARQFEVLAELTRVGLKLVSAVERESEAAGEPGRSERSAADLVKVYERLTRALRFNLALENQITKEHRNRAARERAERDGRCAIGPTARRARLTGKVEHVMNQMIEQEVYPVDREDFRGAMRECLEEFDDDPDFTSRSVGEIVATIANDLYLTPDWSWWQHERWAVKEIRAKTPGSPFADWRDPDDEPDEDGDEPAPETSGHDPPQTVA